MCQSFVQPVANGLVYFAIASTLRAENTILLA